MQNQPPPLQIILFPRPIDPLRTQYPLVLTTLKVVRETFEDKLAKEQSARRARRGKRKAAKLTPKSPPRSSFISFNLDGTLRTLGKRVEPFPTMPIHDTFGFPHLMDPKDFHLFCHLEQEKCLVRNSVTMGTGLEGSLSKTIMRPQNKVLIALDRLMPHLPPLYADKAKEKKVYHKSSP